MARMEGIRRLFRLPPSEARIDRDVDAELAFHFESVVEELIARGVAPDDALREARRRFGDVERVRAGLAALDRQRIGRERRVEWRDALWQDLRYAARGLRKSPGFTAVVVLTLALGIGANATMFGVVDRLLIRGPAHVAAADRVVRPYFRRPRFANDVEIAPNTSYPTYLDLRGARTVFADVAAYFPAGLVVGRGAEAREVRALLATANFYPLLGVRPLLGRFYTSDEDRPPDGVPVVVLGYDYWRSHFGGSRDALGKTMRIGKKLYAIVGVAPRGFTGIDLEPVDIFVPFAAPATENAGDDWSTSRNSMIWLATVARLRPGISLERAAAVATTVIRRGNADTTDVDARSTVVIGPVQQARGPAGGDQAQRAKVSVWLAGVALIVLLIACANVANLLLARAIRRRREIAVRLALGVGRTRLVAQLLTESFLLAALGGASAVLVAQWGGAVVRRLLLSDVEWGGAGVDARVLWFAAGATLLTGVLTGLAPAVQMTRPDLTDALKMGAREGSYHRSRVRTALLVAQGALSVVLLLGAGLFVRSLYNVRHLDYGYDAEKLLFVEVQFPEAYAWERKQALYERMHERLSLFPGVEGASLAITTPFLSRIWGTLAIPGVDTIPATSAGRPLINGVTPDYFRTMGTRVVRGRGFLPTERASTPRVAVVNETMARVVWRGQDPIGKCIKVGGRARPCSEVVGVVQDIKQGQLRESAMQYYVLLAQHDNLGRMRALFIRVRGEPSSLIEPIRRTLVALDPDLRFVNVRPLQTNIDPQVRPWRLGATMFGVFGALALLLAAVGLYSVIAYDVAQRTHEMGVRVALGARPGDVIRLVLGQGMSRALAGLAIGSVLALAAGRAAAPLLFDVSPRDPLVFAAVTLTLLAAAALASLVPAWRATRVDPTEALRTE